MEHKDHTNGPKLKDYSSHQEYITAVWALRDSINEEDLQMYKITCDNLWRCNMDLRSKVMKDPWEHLFQHHHTLVHQLESRFHVAYALAWFKRYEQSEETSIPIAELPVWRATASYLYYKSWLGYKKHYQLLRGHAIIDNTTYHNIDAGMLKELEEVMDSGCLCNCTKCMLTCNNFQPEEEEEE